MPPAAIVLLQQERCSGSRSVVFGCDKTGRVDCLLYLMLAFAPPHLGHDFSFESYVPLSCHASLMTMGLQDFDLM